MFFYELDNCIKLFLFIFRTNIAPGLTCRSHPKQQEQQLFILFCYLREPPHKLTMDLIQVKFNLKRTSSCKKYSDEKV